MGRVETNYSIRQLCSNKNVDIKFSANDAITFSRYAQNRKIEIPNNLKYLRAIKPKGLNRIAEIFKGHICLRMENFSFNNIYII